MVDITIEDSKIKLKVEGADRLWAFKSHLEIPLAHISEVRLDAEAASDWFGGLESVKLIGYDDPGVFKAGTFYEHEQRVFWDVRRPERTVIIELIDERYNELIVEVANPESTATMINDALGRNRST